MKRALYTLIALLILGITALPVAAQAENDEAYEDEYSSGNFGRVRYQENGVTILRAPSADAPEFEDSATVNAPIFPGDIVRTGSDQRAEIQLAGGTVVRVDRAAEVGDCRRSSCADPGAGRCRDRLGTSARRGPRGRPYLQGDPVWRPDRGAASLHAPGRPGAMDRGPGGPLVWSQRTPEP